MSQNYNKRREVPMKHLFDKSDLNVYDTKVVNLSAGAPGPDLLTGCCQNIQKATEHRMKFEYENQAHLFQYGPQIGTDEYRETVAAFLSRGYQEEVNKSDIVVTSGATHGLHLILSTLLDMAAIVFVDEVTYMIALEAFKQFSHMKIVSVPLKEDGPDIEALGRLISQHKFTPSKGKLFWGMYYTIPTYHNPTGMLFSEETNKMLIKLARSSDILITCDDVYNLLSYDNQRPPKRLYAYEIEGINDEDFRGNVISNGTFSKILSPGLRLGWMECPPRCVDAFRNSGILQSGGASNNYTSGVVSSLIQLGLAEVQMKHYAIKYAERMEALCDTLEQNLPPFCSFVRPRGGYFIWIKFPETFDCTKFNQYCMENYGVMAVSGTRFSADKTHQNYMRLTFAFHNAELLRKSVEKLCEAITVFANLI